MYVQTSKETNYEIKTKIYIYIFTFSDIDAEKSCFLCRVKIPYQQVLVFLSFMDIFRSRRSQMFFKIGTLKNFAIF